MEHGGGGTKALYNECRDASGAENGGNQREYDDKCDQERSVSNLRQLELVWSPWAGPGTCQVDINSKGVVAAKPVVKHQQDYGPT